MWNGCGNHPVLLDTPLAESHDTVAMLHTPTKPWRTFILAILAFWFGLIVSFLGFVIGLLFSFVKHGQVGVLTGMFLLAVGVCTSGACLFILLNLEWPESPAGPPVSTVTETAAPPGRAPILQNMNVGYVVTLVAVGLVALPLLPLLRLRGGSSRAASEVIKIASYVRRNGTVVSEHLRRLPGR